MTLVLSTDYDPLPLEPILRWLALRDLLERRLDEVTDDRNGVDDKDLVEYCMVLTSAAEELKLATFHDFSISTIREDFPLVRSQIIVLATKLSMRVSTANAASSVVLPRASKTKLFSQIERLRKLISEAGFSEKQKQKLFSKLDELHQVIAAPRVDFANFMSIFAWLAASIGGTTAFLAEAPEALATIVAIIGEAKEAEEEELLLLQADREPRKLQDLRKNADPSDEIPF